MTRGIVRAALAIAMVLGGCGGPSPGDVELLFEGDDGIRGGIAAGTTEEAIVDGWSVTFDTYAVAVGDVELRGGGDGVFREQQSLVVDLAQLATGRRAALFEGVPAGAWPELFYSTTLVTAETARDETVSQADFDRMVAEGCTYLMRGTLESPSGQRCLLGDPAACTAVTSIAFDLCAPAATVFGPCQSDTGIEGLVVVAGTTTTGTLTIHGDHIFFNGFPEGAEGSIVRRAQWLVNADADADGTVTRADLESIHATDFGTLFPTDPGDGMPGFHFGGAPTIDGHPIETAWDYLRAQLKTQGHFQGEGECPWDGNAG